MFTKACTFLLPVCCDMWTAFWFNLSMKYHQHYRHLKCRDPVCRNTTEKELKMSNNKWPNGLRSENGLEINSVWSPVIMNFEMWIMYHEICLHHRFYLFRDLVAVLKPFQLLRQEFPLQALLVRKKYAVVSIRTAALQCTVENFI